MEGTLLKITLPSLVAMLGLLTPAAAQAYGEGTDDLPSLEERAVHLFTDRLRVDPDATDTDFSDYPAVAPLIHNADLGEAARFHADDMALNDCFQHNSCDDTLFEARLRHYYSGSGFGENIALGSPDASAVVFDGWLYSPPHRENMLSGDWREIGTGAARAEDGPPLWVQDFGIRADAVEPITTSATHWPLRPDAGAELTFYLAGYDPAGTPLSAELLWQDAAHLMDDDRGSDGKQTWSVQLAAGDAACQPYYFVLTRGDESEVTYPSEGTLLVPVGGEDCDAWRAARRPGTGCGSGGGGDFSGTGCASDPDRAGGPDDNVRDASGYSNCTLAPQPRRGSWAALAVLLVQLRRRRR
jgi:hypothetical protein